MVRKKENFICAHVANSSTPKRRFAKTQYTTPSYFRPKYNFSSSPLNNRRFFPRAGYFGKSVGKLPIGVGCLNNHISPRPHRHTNAHTHTHTNTKTDINKKIQI